MRLLRSIDAIPLSKAQILLIKIKIKNDNLSCQVFITSPSAQTVPVATTVNCLVKPRSLVHASKGTSAPIDHQAKHLKFVLLDDTAQLEHNTLKNVLLARSQTKQGCGARISALIVLLGGIVEVMV